MGIDTVASGWWPLLALLGLIGFGLSAALVRHVLPVLLARFDRQALQVVPPGAPMALLLQPFSAPAQATWQRLQDWCADGAGPGNRTFWRPGRPPQIAQRLRVALLGAGPLTAQLRLVETFSRHLDGSVELEGAGSAWAGLWLRLRVKRDDCLWWRARLSTDPWDCGYLVNSVPARAALRHFLPRRASLLVATDDWSSDDLRSEIETLCQRTPCFQHPVRLLILQRETGPLSGEEETLDAGKGQPWGHLPCEISLIEGLGG